MGTFLLWTLGLWAGISLLAILAILVVNLIRRHSGHSNRYLPLLGGIPVASTVGGIALATFALVMLPVASHDTTRTTEVIQPLSEKQYVQTNENGFIYKTSDGEVKSVNQYRDNFYTITPTARGESADQGHLTTIKVEVKHLFLPFIHAEVSDKYELVLPWN